MGEQPHWKRKLNNKTTWISDIIRYTLLQNIQYPVNLYDLILFLTIINIRTYKILGSGGTRTANPMLLQRNIQRNIRPNGPEQKLHLLLHKRPIYRSNRGFPRQVPAFGRRWSRLRLLVNSFIKLDKTAIKSTDFNRETNADVKSFMDELNISGNYAALESYFLQQLFEIADNLNRTAIIWEDMFENGVEINSNDTVVQVWKTDYIEMMEKVCMFWEKHCEKYPLHTTQLLDFLWN